MDYEIDWQELGDQIHENITEAFAELDRLDAELDRLDAEDQE